MNKLDFLRRLDKELSVLDKEERKEILAFYEERFYSGMIYENKTETEVIAELERPEEIARNVLEEYGVSPKFVKVKEERYSNINVWNVIWLIIFDVVVATSIIPALYGAAVGILGSSFTWFSTIGFVLGDSTAVDQYAFGLVTGVYILLFLFGLVVLDAAFWFTRTLIKWHLNVFKLKNRDKMLKKLSHLSLDSWFKKHRFARRLKNIALVASLFTVVITGQWLMRHSDWVEAQYVTQQINETITEDFNTEILSGDEWTINSNMSNIEIEIVLSDTDEVNVYHSYYEDDNFEYEFDFENNTLTLENSTLFPNFNIFISPEEFFKLFNTNNILIIEVPQDLIIETADLTTSNSKIEVKNVDFGSLELHTSNSQIVVSNSNVQTDMKLYTSNSRIVVSNVTSMSNLGLLKLDTSNSTIRLEDAEFPNYDIDSSNGPIYLKNINVELKDGIDIHANTTNSSVNAENVYVNNVHLETSNGPVKYNNDDTSFHPTKITLIKSNSSIDTNVTED